MRQKFYLKTIVLISIALVLSCSIAHGQTLDGFGLGTDKSKSNGPLKISAEKMSVDSAKNLAVFTGNVKIDDDRMTVNCEVMKIYLEAATPQKAEKNSKASEGKQIEKIVCTGDVVITRKVINPEEAEQGTQRAIAGKAVYKLKEKTITLTEKPVVLRGKSKMTGTSLTLHTETNQIQGEKVNISMIQAPKTDKTE